MGLNFKKYAAEGEEFIAELAAKLNCAEDIQKAGRILRASLHAIRNHLNPNESLQLIAQFPMFLKGIYVDRWDVQLSEPKPKTMDSFLYEVRKEAGPTGAYDFPSEEVTENNIRVVFMALRKYISLGELEDIRSMMPKVLKSLFQEDIFH